MSRLTDDLHAKALSIWEAQHAHPFVRGVGDGTLSVERFQHWVRQDYRFLIEYARLLATASARAPDLASMTKMAELTHQTLHTEMALHRSYAASFGITEHELEAEPMAPACQAYADFLVRVATTGDFAELVAALLPCMWGFNEIGRRLAGAGKPGDQRYAAWIDMYAAPEFTELADWCRDLLDHVGQDLPAANKERVEAAFITSSRYEYLFWDMAWNLERWPV